MTPLKAQSPDGFNTCFFQQNLELIGTKVCNAALFSLNSSKLNKELNYTYIALIPKSKNPLCVSNFRPSSMCNVIYKLISKVLANRLKKVLPEIISSYQSAFIPWRLIMDNVLAVYETLHTMHSRMYGKTGLMAVKLDMSKAYDRVEWDFLEAVIRRLGFAGRWINLIMMCVASAHFFVLINGIPARQITLSRCTANLIVLANCTSRLQCSGCVSARSNSQGITFVKNQFKMPKINHILTQSQYQACGVQKI